MTLDDILAHAAALDGVVAMRPQPGDGSPEISWGDVFFYDAPDGRIPPTQPFATIVTKDYPDEPGSGLDAPGAFRLNIAVPATDYAAVLGVPAREAVRADHDPRARDTFFPHPVYGGAGWLSVVDPDRVGPRALELFDAAHRAARSRRERREPGPDES